MLSNGGMLIWIGVIWILSMMTASRYREKVGNNIEYRYGYFWAGILTVPIVLWAGFRGDVEDTGAYRSGFKNTIASLSEIPSYIVSDAKDKGFGVFNIIIKCIIGNRDVVYFLIVAAICGVCVIFTYRKYSCSLIISVFLFVASADCFQWMFNGMRQFIAAAVLFACFGLILNKNYIPAICIILLMSTFHASALLMLPIIFIVQGDPWNKKTILFVILIICCIFFLDQFTSILETLLEDTQYSEVVSQFEVDDGANMLRVLVYSVPTIFAFLQRKRIMYYNDPIINIAVNMSIVSMGLYILSIFTSGIYIGRLPIYFSLYNYILLPWEIKNCFAKRSADIITIMMIGCYLIYNYYQMVITWGYTMF